MDEDDNGKFGIERVKRKTHQLELGYQTHYLIIAKTYQRQIYQLVYPLPAGVAYIWVFIFY